MNFQTAYNANTAWIDIKQTRNRSRDEITSEKVNTQKRDNGKGESKERRSKKLERKKRG